MADTLSSWRASTWQTAIHAAWAARINRGPHRVRCPLCRRPIRPDQDWLVRPQTDAPARPWHGPCARAGSM